MRKIVWRKTAFLAGRIWHSVARARAVSIAAKRWIQGLISAWEVFVGVNAFPQFGFLMAWYEIGQSSGSPARTTRRMASGGRKQHRRENHACAQATPHAELQSLTAHVQISEQGKIGVLHNLDVSWSRNSPDAAD
jgi:hypothetical protein